MQNAKVYLAQALIELMNKKTLDEIHINDLVKRAGVSRMTYYRYFSEKSEILQFYMQYIFDEFMNEVEQSNDNTFRSYNHILQSLIFFKQYKKYALCLHKAGMTGVMMDALNEYIRRLPDFDNEKPARAYSLYLYAGALYNIYIQWVLEDTKTPAEELAKIISKIILL